MKFREVFRYELTHRLRSPSTWVYAIFLFGMGFSLVLDASASAVNINAPKSLADSALFASVFGMVVTAALFGDAAVRDVQAGMDPLLYTSALRKAEYLGGRYLAALTANAILLLAVPLGIALPTLVGYPDPALYGPIRTLAFLQAWLLFLLPNVALIGAIMFTVGVLSRKLLPVFLSGIGIFFSFMFSVESRILGANWDPLAWGALEEATRHWTAAEQNTRLIGFPAGLLLNRVVWLAFAAAMLVFLHRVFRFAHPDGGLRRGRERVDAPELARALPVAVPRVAKAFDFRTTARQTLAIARNSLLEIVGSRWFVVIMLACMLLTMLWGWNVGETVFDTSTWPVTLLVTEVVLSGRAEPIFYLLLALFAGELVWKDRDVSVAEIVDATPVPNGVALLGRFLALLAMLVLFLSAAIVGGILIQAFQGYYNFEPALYLRVVFGLNLADYVLFAALAMTIHVVVNHKYIGHILTLMAWGFTMAAGQLGIRHHLLVYNSRPDWSYSDMNGFGPFVEPIVWFKLYWAAWALLLSVLACVLWVRGSESGMRHRLLEARARFRGTALRAAGVATILIVVLGGFIFYNTNVLNEYATLDKRGAAYVAYETRYSRFKDVPQPTITGVELRVEIYPDKPAVDLRGSYSLVNRSGEAVDSVHVYLSRRIVTRELSLNRAAKPVLVDAEAGYRIFALTQRLEPGDSLRLSFDVAFRPRGFPNDEPQTDVVHNGAYFNRSWLPFIGYQPTLELPDPETRKRLGLAPRPPVPAPDDAAARQLRSSIRNEERVHMDAIIGTAANQIAVTPGVLRRSWTKNGRRYFHYQTELPTGFGGTVFSGEYAVLEDRWNDVALQIFYHPTHEYNLDRMVRGMKASLEYFTTQFGPYPDSQLRIVEFPRYGGFGHAHPHTIAFAEDAFLSRVKEGEIDQPFYGTAHEVAHQWWPGQAQTAPVRGHRFLSESLANYSAMMVVEKTHGPDVAGRVYGFHKDLYLRGRSSQAREVPLLDVTDQSYIAYRKGAIAMYTLREQLGEHAVNSALRRYLEKHRAGKPPYATSLDLYAELRAVTPDSLRYLLTDLFETVTLWDVKTERAVMDSSGGEYRVTLDVVAKKMRADSAGNETEVPMNDFVEIGVFAPGKGAALGEPLYLKQHRIQSGKQTIRITVPREPARAGIDPFDKLIDRKGGDNVVEVKAVGAGPVAAGR